MKQKIVVCKTFGFPGRIERIGRKLLAVHMDKDLLSPGGIIRADIATEIVFNPAPLIVVGAPALFPVFPPDLKAVEKELAHIVADTLEIFDQFLKVCHGFLPV